MAVTEVNQAYKPPKRSVWGKIFSPLLKIASVAAAPFSGGASLAAGAATMVGDAVDKPKGGEYQPTVPPVSGGTPANITPVSNVNQKAPSSSPLDKVAGIAGLAGQVYGAGKTIAGALPGGAPDMAPKGQHSLTKGPQPKPQPSFGKYDMSKEIVKRPELMGSYLNQGIEALEDPQVIQAYGGPEGIAQLRDLFDSARLARPGIPQPAQETLFNSRSGFLKRRGEY